MTATYPAHLLPALPGYPETPVTVVGRIGARFEIRIDNSGAYCAIDGNRIRFTPAALAQLQFEAMFPAGHIPKTDTRTPAQVRSTR